MTSFFAKQLGSLWRVALPLLLLASHSSIQAAEPAPSFGFTGPEAFPLDHGIAHLRSADLDGDGMKDLIVANNLKARVSLLLNRTGKPAEESRGPVRKSDINELPPDARFKLESLTSEKRIASMEVADLNGDGLADIVYLGEPKPVELVVHYGQPGMTWAQAKRWTLEEAQLLPDALAVGDLNADGMPDVLVLADNHLALLLQRKDHTLAEPEKIPFTGTVRMLKIADLNGDGLSDLILANPDNANPFRFRFQAPSGRLGPEIHFAAPPVRSLAVEDLDGDGTAEIIRIGQNSGRISVANVIRKPAPALSGVLAQGQFQVIPFGRSGKARRGMAWGDVNGDGLADLLVAQPETGQVSLHVQEGNGQLGPHRTFPSLAGIQEIAILPQTASQPPEIFLLSQDERQIGRTRLSAEGRIAFPTPLAVEGRPLTMGAGSLRAGEDAVVAAILDSQDRRQLVIAGRDGRIIHSQNLAASFKGTPSAMVFHDVDQDGATDLVALVPYEKLKVFLQTPGKDFEMIDVAPPGGTAEQPWASAADVDGDGKAELLMAQKNFVRAVTLRKDEAGAWVLAVKDQINGASPTSKIAGAAPLREGSNTIESLFLLDADRKALTLSERDSSAVWQTVKTLPLPFSDFSEIRSVAIGGPSSNSILCLGNNGVGWLRTDGELWEVVDRDGYETLVPEGRLSGINAGDLNSDGARDLVLLETARNHIELVSYSKERKVHPGNRWQVFEERTFRNRRSEGTEPREAWVGDLNHDGRNDLAILVHDRVLVYFQQ